MSSARTSLLGLGTALPPFSGTQAQVARFMSRVVAESAAPPRRERTLALIEQIYESCGIQRRFSAIPDFGLEDPQGFRFFPPTWTLEPFPGTARRMRLYEEVSVELAESAARRALARAGIEPRQVSHLVISTCTGFFAPGLDILLGQRLGLRPTVARTLIGFMGCYAGFNALRAADHIVRAEPEAVVLQVSVELCTIHFQKSLEPDALVANCLFADGCAAAVYGASERHGAGLAVIECTRSLAASGSLEQMSWHIGDSGFVMRLSAAVPRTLEVEAPGFASALLDEAGYRREEVVSWALHPGGRRIIDALREALGLAAGEVAPSLEVLRDHGNMSSATIFFVLQKLLDGVARPGPLVALGFGPGLTIEGAVLAVGGS
jgi:alpha-pyrone synthase